MAKKSVSDLDFEFNDFGDLELSGFAEGDEFEEEELLEDEEEVEELEDDEEVEDDGDQEVEAPTLKSRLDALERSMQALPQMISNAIASSLGGGKGNQKQDDDDEDIPDELDNKQMVNILAKRMQKAVKAEVVNAVKDMKETDPDLRDARITAEFQRCNTKYGQKFRDRMIPVAKIVQRSNYGISVEDAYLTIADIPVPTQRQGQVKKAPLAKGKVPRQVKVDADSDDSVGDINQQNPRPKLDIKKIKQVTDADMFQHAWNTSLMSAARGARRRRG